MSISQKIIEDSDVFADIIIPIARLHDRVGIQHIFNPEFTPGRFCTNVNVPGYPGGKIYSLHTMDQNQRNVDDMTESELELTVRQIGVTTEELEKAKMEENYFGLLKRWILNDRKQRTDQPSQRESTNQEAPRSWVEIAHSNESEVAQPLPVAQPQVVEPIVPTLPQAPFLGPLGGAIHRKPLRSQSLDRTRTPHSNRSEGGAGYRGGNRDRSQQRNKKDDRNTPCRFDKTLLCTSGIYCDFDHDYKTPLAPNRLKVYLDTLVGELKKQGDKRDRDHKVMLQLFESQSQLINQLLCSQVDLQNRLDALTMDLKTLGVNPRNISLRPKIQKPKSDMLSMDMKDRVSKLRQKTLF